MFSAQYKIRAVCCLFLQVHHLCTVLLYLAIRAHLSSSDCNGIELYPGMFNFAELCFKMLVCLFQFSVFNKKTHCQSCCLKFLFECFPTNEANTRNLPCTETTSSGMSLQLLKLQFGAQVQTLHHVGVIPVTKQRFLDSEQRDISLSKCKEPRKLCTHRAHNIHFIW